MGGRRAECGYRSAHRVTCPREPRPKSQPALVPAHRTSPVGDALVTTALTRRTAPACGRPDDDAHSSVSFSRSGGTVAPSSDGGVTIG